MKTTLKPQREIIYEKIIEYINSGKISTGERLTEEQLAKKFHVSRTPVREALLMLEKKGLLMIRLNSGAVVKKITVAQVEEIYNIVSVLEGYAVETVAGNGVNEKELTYLHKLQGEMERRASKNDYFRYAEANAAFHNFFIKRTKNTALSDTIRDLRSRILNTIRLAVPTHPHINQYLLSHRKILEAVSQGKPYQSGLRMRKHVQEVKTFATGWLRPQ